MENESVFREVLKHEGVTTIVTINGNPAHVVNTWNSYVVFQNGKLLIPAAGMHGIENDFAKDNTVTVAIGSKEVPGTIGPGTGFHVHGRGQFVTSGEDYDAAKKKFPWITRLLVVDVHDIEQRI